MTVTVSALHIAGLFRPSVAVERSSTITGCAATIPLMGLSKAITAPICAAQCPMLARNGFVPDPEVAIGPFDLHKNIHRLPVMFLLQCGGDAGDVDVRVIFAENGESF